jgi:hypothetical protein
MTLKGAKRKDLDTVQWTAIRNAEFCCVIVLVVRVKSDTGRCSFISKI